MNIPILTAVLFIACAAPAAAADDCARATDACAAGARTSSSPFLKASLEGGLPKALPAPVKPAALKQAPAAAKADPGKDPAAPAAPAAASVPAGEGSAQLSSPLWILFIAGGLAALYFYLDGGRRKKRKC